MPLYDFASSDGNIVEKFFKMSEVPQKFIENNIEYIRIYNSVPMAIIDLNKPKTIGSLADKNTREMVKRGDPRIKKSKPPPFWRKNRKKPLNISGWSKQKMKKYVETGKE